ncbi:hypothetical protein Bca52824_060651 [Brassica carinata]|uniref:Uncharacterized protein n=1 Tax=Brassica carinata TaxID=52824 RepID=A0A8X7QXX6_BRACI|nr:hypothetical protein Bca52824_060651 [Brassica carinata]
MDWILYQTSVDGQSYAIKYMGSHMCERAKRRPDEELVKLQTNKKTNKGTNTRDRVKFSIQEVTDLFRSLDVVKQITSITIEPGIEDKFNTSES